MKSITKLATTLAIPFLFLGACTSQTAFEPKEIRISSVDQNKLFAPQTLEASFVQEAKTNFTIALDSSVHYQEMDGFGYTLTGGSALHLSRMSADKRAALLQEVFGFEKENEIGVSYLRISVAGSDLDTFPYSFNELPEGVQEDLELKHFDISEIKREFIPILKEILAVNPELKIMGSPWSPPTWMKTKPDFRGGELQPKYYQVYAQYLAKFIQTMKAEGIRIDALTVQNEPLHPGNNPSLLMKAEDQAIFVKTALGPVFEKEGIDTKIIIYDHNADRPDYPITVLNDPEAKKYIDGSAFHLYGGKIEALSEVHEAHPDRNLYFTEQWIGAPANFKEDIKWHTRELIIGASRNWCKTVLEWNFAADSNNEPHTDRGGCDRCLGAVTIDGDQVKRNPAYYIIAHASKYVRPGSVRIKTNALAELPNVAFKTPKQEIVQVILNNTDQEKTFTVQLGQQTKQFKIAAADVMTIVW